MATSSGKIREFLGYSLLAAMLMAPSVTIGWFVLTKYIHVIVTPHAVAWTIWVATCVATLIVTCVISAADEGELTDFWMFVLVGVPLAMGICLPWVLAGSPLLTMATVFLVGPLTCVAGFLVVILWTIVLSPFAPPRFQITEVRGNPNIIPMGD